MNGVWNLDPIYRGFDDPAYQHDLQTLSQKVAEFAAFTEGLAEDGDAKAALRQGILLQEQLSELIENLALFASLRQSANTRDAQAGSYMGRIMALYSQTAAPQAAFENWASARLAQKSRTCVRKWRIAWARA